VLLRKLEVFLLMKHCFLEGFDALEYQEHLDYDLIQSTNPEFNKAIVRVNIFRDHRQTIQVKTKAVPSNT